MPERKPLIVDDTFITVPVSDGVQKVLDAWVTTHVATLNEALAPFNLSAYDIAMPEFHRLVYKDEMDAEISARERSKS